MSEQDALAANLAAACGLLLADRQTTAVERRTGLPGNAAAALVVVGHAPGATIDFVRRVLGRSHSSVVRLVASLVDRGLLKRSAGDDGRVVSLTLTAAGRRLVGSALRARSQAVAEQLAVLTREERRALTTIAGKLLTNAVDDEVSAYRLCRLCDADACLEGECPVVAGLEDHA